MQHDFVEDTMQCNQCNLLYNDNTAGESCPITLLELGVGVQL